MFDMGRFPGAVVAIDQNPPVKGKAGQNCSGGIGIKNVSLINLGHVLGHLPERRNLKITVEAEDLFNINLQVRLVQLGN